MSNYPYDNRAIDVIFIADVFELAFGDDAIDKGYSYADVLTQLREFSDKALVTDGHGLTQEEVDTLLSSKTGGMFHEL
tara:strand:+ start:846 stop:1079 length:234 start_codon:yes stop_codon:yes gene_type:complete